VVWRAKPLRNDALTAELTVMLKEDVAIALE
jgi:hypothetical protein